MFVTRLLKCGDVHLVEYPGPDDLLHVEAGQLLLGLQRRLLADRDQGEADNAEAGHDPAQQKKAVGDPETNFPLTIYRSIVLFHLSRTSGSKKYFSSSHPDAWVVLSPQAETGSTLSGFTKAVSVGIHITEPNP